MLDRQRFASLNFKRLVVRRTKIALSERATRSPLKKLAGERGKSGCSGPASDNRRDGDTSKRVRAGPERVRFLVQVLVHCHKQHYRAGSNAMAIYSQLRACGTRAGRKPHGASSSVLGGKPR